AHSLQISSLFSGLLSTTTAAHLHCCTLPNAGVATQTPSFLNFPLGVTSGSFNQTLDTGLASSYNPAFVNLFAGSVPAAEAALFTGINAGIVYFNIHTAAPAGFPGGEIRGFLAAQLPEPATVVLVGSGLIGIVAISRKRRTI